ncbi:hypothetical protein HK102_001980 [Quaeritorhiza haematococci]|nr:hypothetical protein HK102_001980 [Quaeritorhiza haematococci]
MPVPTSNHVYHQRIDDHDTVFPKETKLPSPYHEPTKATTTAPLTAPTSSNTPAKFSYSFGMRLHKTVKSITKKLRMSTHPGGVGGGVPKKGTPSAGCADLVASENGRDGVDAEDGDHLPLVMVRSTEAESGDVSPSMTTVNPDPQSGGSLSRFMSTILSTSTSSTRPQPHADPSQDGKGKKRKGKKRDSGISVSGSSPESSPPTSPVLCTPNGDTSTLIDKKSIVPNAAAATQIHADATEETPIFIPSVVDNVAAVFASKKGKEREDIIKQGRSSTASECHEAPAPPTHKPKGILRGSKPAEENTKI